MLDSLRKRFGGGDLMDLPKPESLHRGTPLLVKGKSTKAKTKKVKAKMSKVHKGRKRTAPSGPLGAGDVIDV